MAGKSTQDNCFQLVFLIDSNPAFWGPNYSAVDASNAIVLWVMRVLNYFNDYDKRKRSNLRWGYHFFTSRSLSHHVERRDFSEFSMGVFEEFEKHASKKFSDSFPQSHATSDLEETVAFTKPPAGAKSISCAFTNAMHDFQWDGPDTNSPVRRTQHNVINRKTRNVLFLLSGCPCDDASIRDFRGEGLGALTSLESLRNILMPSVLYNEFKEHDICLQWVNIGDIPSEKNSSVRPFLEGFLREFKGGIIPLISNGFSSACQSVSTLEEICCSFHGPFLPFKTVMDFYLAGKIPCLSEVIHGVEDHPKRNPCMPGIQGLLCSSGGVMKVHCSVWLSSMFQSAVRMYRPRNNDQASSVADNEQKKTGLQGACPMLLWIRGVIRNNHICPSWMHPLNAYSCIARDCRQMSTGSSLCSEEFISGWFQELLLSLAKECKSLVIDMIDGENGFPVCGILQPLTSVCSVISIISSNFLLKFEKCLFGNGEIASLDCSSIKSVKSCCDLITELGCKGVSKAALQPTSAGVFACLTGSQKYPQETAGEKEFKPGIVESWCLSPVVDEEERLLWSELKRRECKPQVHCVDGLATPMKDLKILYYRKNEKTKLEVVKQPLTCKSNSQGILKKLQGQKDVIKTSANEVSNTLQSSINKDDRSTIDPLVQMNESSKCLIEEHNQTSCTTDEETKNLTCHAEDESHLISAICSIYDKVLFEGGSVPTEITNIMMSVSNFYQKDGNERKKDFISQFLIENVLLNLVKLRAKYEGSGTGCTKEHQVKEYQLQVLLRIEIAALAKCDDQSNLVQEVTDLLRALSFMKDPDFLATFLSEEILSM
ncbi:treslin-like [Montipora foliosa]|uniref:treslin-like n=1 Tax=Montipora foliosa TaxID=591990 RepID=UPI0035F1CA15